MDSLGVLDAEVIRVVQGETRDGFSIDLVGHNVLAKCRSI